HSCKCVCHKYGNNDQCRFLFLHEIVEQSYYDADSKSVVLKCRDGTVNFFNPYILMYCRHNHDLKCILSGRAAKAAMFYITDYITKSDLKTHEMLSLLSCVVVQMSSRPQQSEVEGAKQLLHRCLSQYVKQQQIHVQQAAHYLRGFSDNIPSH
ncbi:hypothetical protein DEU56DRAFT_707660, partial [Suillus clintonianus]|uniref:uncharacterized protein n=1 Tax=Suillus clintonianus TaxID=1904413 RepID=UPI001B86ACA2